MGSCPPRDNGKPATKPKPRKTRGPLARILNNVLSRREAIGWAAAFAVLGMVIDRIVIHFGG